MLPYIVLFAAVIFFVLKGMGWLDEWADRQSRRPQRPSAWKARREPSDEEARRLEVYKQFLEGGDSPEDETDS